MKKLLLITFLAVIFFSVSANDTLTIRQAFNFNIGDTFDYKITSSETYIPAFSVTSFRRIIITDKLLSPDSQTLTYICQLVFPVNGTDTVIYSSLDSSIIKIDTIPGEFSQGYQFQTGLDSNSLITNSSNWSGIDIGVQKTYTAGLGLSSAHHGWGNPDDGFGEEDTDLIYFAKGNMKGGTPYYDQPTGISSMSNSSQVHLFPNPTSGIIYFSLDPFQGDCKFIVTDMLGQEILSKSISTNITPLDISNLSAGIYTWQLISQKEIVRTGRIVKE